MGVLVKTWHNLQKKKKVLKVLKFNSQVFLYQYKVSTTMITDSSTCG